MVISTITRNNQITISKEARKTLGLKIGDNMIESIEKGKIVLKKVESDIVEKAFGRWRDMKETGTEYTKRIRKEWEERNE